MISAGFIGAAIALCGMFLLNAGKQENEHINVPNAQFTSLGLPAMTGTGGDFVESAKTSTKSVVHIFAEESPEQVQKRQLKQRYRNPFADFFGFDDYFGGEHFYTPRNGSGSGVIYSNEGYIITNNHVVGFADKLTVTDYEGKKYTARKIGTDESTDLAVIKIDGAKGLIPMKIGNSDKVNVGEWVLAVGNPFGYLTSTVTAGIVSAKGRSLNLAHENTRVIEEFIQTDAAINPGNSGGALVNLQGELIGINTAIATPTGVFAGYSFAIPSNIVSRVTKDIIENGGDIERANLGVGGYDVNDELAKEFNLKLKSNLGFYIEEVEKQSAAQLGGLLPGDVIIGINSNAVHNYDDIVKHMKFSKVGDKVNIKINRNGKEMNLPIQLMKSF